jgi:hypothetical protein
MADITNPQAVKFSNEEIRTAANDFAQLYYRAKRVYQSWTALGMSSLITNSGDDTIIDGSATDGRPVITGADGNNIINRVSEFITSMEDSSNAKLNTILAVAPQPGASVPD